MRFIIYEARKNYYPALENLYFGFQKQNYKNM